MNAIRNSPIRMVVLGLLALVATALAFGFANSRNQTPAQEHVVAVEHLGTPRASVALRPEVADVALRAAASDDGMLIAGTVATRHGEELQQHVEQEADYRDVALRTHTGMGIHMNVQEPSWNLHLARDTPIDLQVHAQISRLDLDLRGTRVETLDVRNDTGRSHVYLPAGDVSGAIATDVGDIVLHVPRDADATIQVRRAISAVRADDAFARVDGSWRLAGSGPRIDLRVSNSVGAIRLATY